MTSVVNLVPKGSAGRCGKLQEDRKPVSEDFLTNTRPYFPLMVILSALPHIRLRYLMVVQIQEIMLKKLCNILLLGIINLSFLLLVNIFKDFAHLNILYSVMRLYCTFKPQFFFHAG